MHLGSIRFFHPRITRFVIGIGFEIFHGVRCGSHIRIFGSGIENLNLEFHNLGYGTAHSVVYNFKTYPNAAGYALSARKTLQNKTVAVARSAVGARADSSAHVYVGHVAVSGVIKRQEITAFVVNTHLDTAAHTVKLYSVAVGVVE